MASSLPLSIPVRACAQSDIGRIRKNNEDAVLCEPTLGLYAVADGMGGHAGGEVASAMAIAGLQRAVTALPDRAFLADPSLSNRRQLLQFLGRAVSEINATIFARGQDDLSLRGMGCTLDVVLLRGHSLFLAHVGDSRVYGLLGGTLYQLTEDHTLGQTLLNSGAMSEAEVAKHPQRNLLMRALGVYPKVEIDTAYLDVAPEDVFMLCSDGVYGMVDRPRLQQALALSSDQAAPALIQAALEGGGRDNASAVVIQVLAGCDAAAIRVGSEEVRAAMAQASLFTDFTAPELLRVQQIAIGQLLAAGEIVFEAGQRVNDIYLVLDGRMSIWRDGIKAGWMGPGDPFGELSLMPGDSMVTVKAEQPSRILRFPLEQVQNMIRSDSSLGVKLALNALHRVWQRFLSLGDRAARLASGRS